MKHITDALGPIIHRRFYRQKSYFTSYGYFRPETNVLSYIRVQTLTVPNDPNAVVLSINIYRDENPVPDMLKHLMLLQ
jgi:hypothetical protein